MDIYKNLPPLEKTRDGKPYEIAPELRNRVNSLIRRECCNCMNKNCIALEDYDSHTCPQLISLSVCCKWFRWAVLLLDEALEAEIYKNWGRKRCAVCGAVFLLGSNRARYCRSCAAKVHREQKKKSARKRRSMQTVRG